MPADGEALMRLLSGIRGDPAVRCAWGEPLPHYHWASEKEKAARAEIQQKRLEIFTELLGMIRGEVPFKLEYTK